MESFIEREEALRGTEGSVVGGGDEVMGCSVLLDVEELDILVVEELDTLVVEELSVVESVDDKLIVELKVEVDEIETDVLDVDTGVVVDKVVVVIEGVFVGGVKVGIGVVVLSLGSTLK